MKLSVGKRGEHVVIIPRSNVAKYEGTTKHWVKVRFRVEVRVSAREIKKKG
jgi:hypothetical protein